MMAVKSQNHCFSLLARQSKRGMKPERRGRKRERQSQSSVCEATHKSSYEREKTLSGLRHRSGETDGCRGKGRERHQSEQKPKMVAVGRNVQ